MAFRHLLVVALLLSSEWIALSSAMSAKEFFDQGEANLRKLAETAKENERNQCGKDPYTLATQYGPGFLFVCRFDSVEFGYRLSIARSRHVFRRPRACLPLRHPLSSELNHEDKITILCLRTIRYRQKVGYIFDQMYYHVKHCSFTVYQRPKPSPWRISTPGPGLGLRIHLCANER